MIKKKSLKLGMLSLSAGLLFAACERDAAAPMEEDITETVDVEPIEETPADDESTEDDMNDADDTASNDAVNPMETPGIEGLELPITLNSAIDIFYETFGSEEINIDHIEFDEDDGRYLFGFDGWDGEFEYELDIDAETGGIFKQEQELDSDTDDILDLEEMITPNEAMEAALEASGSGYVEEWELEVENSQTIYDIDIEEGDDQKIDAVTGEIF